MTRFKPSSKHEFIKEEILKVIEKQGLDTNQLPSEGFLAKKIGISPAKER